MESPNIYETAHRFEKVVALTDLIWPLYQKLPEVNQRMSAADWVEGMDDVHRAHVSDAAGVEYSPSAETWAQVIERLRMIQGREAVVGNAASRLSEADEHAGLELVR